MGKMVWRSIEGRTEEAMRVRKKRRLSVAK